MIHFKAHIKFCNGCHIRNRIYFANLTFNGLFYIDLEDFSLHFVHRFLCEALSSSAYSMANIVDNKDLYFFPHNSNSIIRYNIEKQREWVLPLSEFCGNYFGTAGVIYWNHKIYIFPIVLKKGIYILDLQRQNVVKDKSLSDLFADTDFSCVNVFFVKDKCALLSLDNSNQLVEVDLETKAITGFDTLPEEVKIYTVCSDGVHYWILQQETTDIYEWDREHGTLQLYTNYNSEHMVSRPYSNLIFLEDEILVLNCSLQSIMRINKDKKIIENMIAFPEGFRTVNSRFRGWPICDGFMVLDDKVLLYPCWGNMLLVYDLKSKELTGKEIVVTDEGLPYLCEVVDEIFSGEEQNVEKDELETVELFVQAVSAGQETGRIHKADKIGKMIYHKIEDRDL